MRAEGAGATQNIYRKYTFSITYCPRTSPVHPLSSHNSPVSVAKSPVSAQVAPCVRPTQDTGGVPMSEYF